MTPSLYAALILSLWSGLLSGAGTAGQLIMNKGAVLINEYPAIGESTVASHPRTIVLVAVVIFFVPVFLSCFYVLRYIKRTGRAGTPVYATLIINTYSLLYGLFLYGLLA